MDRELDVACDLARSAGGVLLGHFGKPLAVDAKENDEPVTIADRQSSELIVGGLHRAFPDDLVISEEAEPDLERLARGGRVWFVDPLRGLHNFSVLIGLAVDGVPALGVVYQPTADVLYRAAAGHPAEQATAQATSTLGVSTISDGSNARLCVSQSDRRPVIDEIKAQLRITREEPMGSVGLKFCSIAAGRSDLYINPTAGAKAWDTCASLAILRSAGGQASNVFGESLIYSGPELWHTRGIVASNQVLQRTATEATRAVFARRGRLGLDLD